MIACVSHKAGRGKTSVAQAIAVKLALSGASVKIFDNDNAAGSNRIWAKRRMEAGIKPTIPVSFCDTVGDVGAQQAGFEYIVLDSDTFSTEFRGGVKPFADLIILLTYAREEDVGSTLDLAKYYDAKGELGRVAICFNLVSALKDDIEAALQLVSKSPHHVLAEFLPKHSDYRVCRDQGRSLIETDEPRSLDAAKDVIGSIIERVDEVKKIRLAEYVLSEPKPINRLLPGNLG